jgi:hypothetical protein
LGREKRKSKRKRGKEKGRKEKEKEKEKEKKKIRRHTSPLESTTSCKMGMWEERSKYMSWCKRVIT